MALHHLRTYVERTRQKRKALLMLALSGVVRPSHVELRYGIPLMKVQQRSSTFPDIPSTADRPVGLMRKFFELMSRRTNPERPPRPHLPHHNQFRFRKPLPTHVHSSP
jgi:hypothetical protein